MNNNIFIIVPCYNEAARLKERLRDFISSPYRFVFVNDGSSDGTNELLRNNVKDPNYVVSLDRNSGKSAAVRAGVLFIRSLKEFNEVEWVGFWDADMATPIGEIPEFLEYVRDHGDADAVYGSRVLKLGSTIERRFSRHILGRIFCTITSICLGLKCYDSQCGAKLFKKATLDKAFGEPFISKWVFDLEIILRLAGFKQIEYPVTKWEDVKGSKITPLKSFLSVSSDIWKIYKKYR